MESPTYLFDQFAKAHGMSAPMAKRALMLKAFAAECRPIKDAAMSLKIAESSARKICRQMMIDFPDYRPYAALEKKGKERPKPSLKADLPAAGLPLFAAH